MSSSWNTRRLADLCASVDYGFTASATHEPTGSRFLRITDIRQERLRWSQVPFVVATTEQQAKYALADGDIVVARTGAFTGHNALVRDPPPAIFASYLVRLRAAPEADPRFLYYYMQSRLYVDHVAAVIGGSAQPNASAKVLTAAELLVPPLDEQRAIATVLGALDDRIEANRALNETLEATCQALFRSWFVDFDPVVAKSEGRRPARLTDEVAALFPDRFEDSPIGPVPAGWKVGPVGDEYELIMGQSPPGSTYNENGLGLPFYQGRTDFRERYPVRRVYCTAPTRLAEEGDTLVSVRAPVGDTNQALEQCALGRGVGAVRHRRGMTSFTYYQMGALREEFDVYNGYGTLFGSINKGDFAKLPIVVPIADVVARFEEVAGRMDETFRANSLEQQTLGLLRDALLPRLLSGELRVRQAEQLVEEAI